jgi:hypothetical protein
MWLKRAFWPSILLAMVGLIATTGVALAWGPWTRHLLLDTAPFSRTIAIHTDWWSAPYRFLAGRLRPSGELMLLPTSTAQSSSMNWTDTIPLQDATACYLTAPYPESFPGSVPYTSDLGCVIPGSATGLAPARVVLQTQQCQGICSTYFHVTPYHTTTLSWIAPSGEFTGYTVVQLVGGVLTSVPKTKGSESFTAPLDQAGCYGVFVLNGTATVGNSDVLCTAPLPYQGP